MGPVTIGSLIQRSFLIFRSGFVSFATLALICYSPILLWQHLAPETGPPGTDLRSFLATGPGFVLVIANVVVIPVASAAVVLSVFLGLRGRPATIGQCLSVAATRGPEILGLAILNMLAVGLGFLLCITPGVILACGFFIAGPALIIEKLNPIAAMRRSWQLTDGYKLAIFILTLAIGVIQFGVSMASTTAFGAEAVGTGTFGSEEATAIGFGLPELLDGLVTIVFIAFNAVVAAVVYHDLRSFREGPDDGAPVIKGPLDSTRP